MAHYNAINESRFTFSHEDAYLPLYGLEGIMKKEKVTMRFQTLKGKQYSFNKAMNYLYRPLAMEHMCPYQYYSETEFIKRSDVQK
jgi:hypothetical protein